MWPSSTHLTENKFGKLFTISFFYFCKLRVVQSWKTSDYYYLWNCSLQSFFSMCLPLFLFPFMAASHPDSVGVPCTFQLLNPCHSHRGIPDCGFWLVIICLAFKLNLSMSASDNVVNFCCYFCIETTDICFLFLTLSKVFSFRSPR